MPGKPTNTHYQTLLKTIKQSMACGVEAAERELQYQKMTTYWQIGRHIACYDLRKDGTSTYGSALYKNLSKDTGLSVELLGRMVRFQKVYPRRPKRSALTWTHYRTLMRIEDEKSRLKWEHRALAQNISSYELRFLVKEDKQKRVARKTGQSARLDVVRGTPYLYRIRPANSLHGKTNICEIDCGFNTGYDQPPGSTIKLIKGMIVVSKKQKQGYVLTQSTLPREHLYTYPAKIERVVDGDTLKVRVDLGFGVRSVQWLRLRGIDTAEKDTERGQMAKRFMEELFRKQKYVVIKTYGTDQFDRYLVDVFYLSGNHNPFTIAAEGELLNQTLLDEGHAVIWA